MVKVNYNFLPSGETELIDDVIQPDKTVTSEPIISPPLASTPAEVRENLFGLKQGTPVSMAYNAMLATDEGKDRPFDYSPDLDNQELPPDKDEIKKETILEFWKYSDEAYFNKEKFDAKEVKYEDQRDESRLYEINGSECRVYQWGKKMIISFRGTDTTEGFITTTFMTDILTDLSTKIQSLNYIDIGDTYTSDYRGIVHQGFADYTMHLYPVLARLVNSVYGSEVEELYVCGHSLGGIAAQIFSYKLLVEENIKAKTVYTFGSPTGIFTFGDVLENDMNIINVLHTHDIVGYLAPFFQHHGYKIMIDLDNNVHVYKPFEDIPSHYYDKEAVIKYALRKNGVYGREDITSRVKESQGELDRYGLALAINKEEDKVYDKYVNSGKISNNLDNIRSFVSSMNYRPQQESLYKIGKILREAGMTFYHTQYNDFLQKLPDIINLKPETNTYNNPNIRLNHTPEKDRYKYQGTIHGEHLYKDLVDEKLITTTNTTEGIHITHINKTNPLGIYFYEKDEDILNKAIVFYN